jgi:ADP-dependent NAD(P)H-hydrate dehydratase / NAD(P)H-hydrate epimerase
MSFSFANMTPMHPNSGPSTYPAHLQPQIDAIAASSLGTNADQLMRRAGGAIHQLILARFPLVSHFLVLCGPGNNGGDGYVIAQLLRESHRKVTVVAAHAPKTALAQRACAAFVSAGGECLNHIAPEQFTGAELIIDALYGITTRQFEGADAELVRWANASGLPIVAVDLPSGLNCDTGATRLAIKATLCATVLSHKAGLHTGMGRAYTGEVVLVDLGVPASSFAALAPNALLQSQLQWLVPVRDRCAHKGHFGHVVFVAGSMLGATRLAACAALRTGAGLVSVCADAAQHGALVGARAELMCVPASPGWQLPTRANVLAIGPGLGQSAHAQTQLPYTLDLARTAQIPIVLDADALNLFAAAIEANASLTLPADVVLTPHPAEAARLLQSSVNEIEQDRLVAVARLVEKFATVVVLKGAGTIIGGPQQTPHICTRGNPGMASGGMGDVLTGVIAGLLAQGLTPFQAACDGVCAHALAGDWAAKKGERGMLAMDVINALRRCVNDHRVFRNR